MRDPHWTKVANGVSHGGFTAEDISGLPPADRDYAYRVVSHLDSPVPAEQAMRWYLQAPSGITAGLAGAAKVREAKRVRTGRRLFEMTPNEMARYQVLLADAEVFLVNAISHYPDEVLPWVPRLDIARGLKRTLPELRRMFSEAQARERWHFLSCEAAWEGHTPHWLGSYEELFDFSDDALSAPRGHAARALVAYAEAERITWDRNLDLSLMPSRSHLNLHGEFVSYARSLPQELGPDDVIAAGAWLYVVSPKTPEEARATSQLVSAVAGRVGGYPYASLNEPLGWFRRILELRIEEASALL